MVHWLKWYLSNRTQFSNNIKLNSLFEYFNVLSLKISTQKSLIIKFCLCQKDPDQSPTVVLDETEIEEVAMTKLHGI